MTALPAAEARFALDVVDALSDRTVLLDRVGRVTDLSGAPALAPLELLTPCPLLSPGVSYLGLCRRAEAAGLATGVLFEEVTAALQGTHRDAHLELHGAERCSRCG